MTKVMIINGSPRKNFNTAKMRDEQFPKDLEKAYELGKRLATTTF